MSLLYRALVAVLSMLFVSFQVSAQVSEAEPNNTCETAQVVGDPGPPVVVLGSLDSEPESPDVDFFHLTGTPGEALQVDLEGAATGMGTLSDPFLGFFNSACELQALNDDYGGLNSRLNLTVPGDGVYILAATTCCDSEFVGGGIGTYTMTVIAPSLIDSITGTVVDADTSQPLADVYAELDRCDLSGCWMWMGSQFTGPDGTFLFQTDGQGNPLTAGSYAVRLQRNQYNDAFVGPFDVAEGQALDLGAIPMARIEYIGVITGRLVDAISGAPLPGGPPSYSVIQIERCEEWGCSPLWGQPPDEEGYFWFDGPSFYLPPGNYRVIANAEDYYTAETPIMYGGDGDEIDFGDIALMPYPIGFGDITGCDVLPMGGTCDFSVQITNRGPGRYRGEAWAIARYLALDPPNRATRFQIGRMGAQNPNPQRLNLAEGKQTTLTFRLDVPANAVEGWNVCISANVGRDPSPQFDSAGDRLLFCAAVQPDGNMTRLSSKESHRLLQRVETPRR